jgi:hypothetical protein
MKIKLIILTGLITISTSVMAIGPEYNKGEGLQHHTSCIPPTTRAENAEGVQIPITQAELDKGTVYLYQGGNIFTAGVLIGGPVDTDIFCNHDWNIDDYQSGQKFVFATVTDTDGRTSEVSVEGGPFSSVLPLMPPNAPIMTIQ